MTEQELRTKVVSIAQSYIGCKESDGSHRKIVDLYNSHKPLARGYKVTYTDAWCATFASAVAIQAGLTDIIPTECGCSAMIELFRKLDSWQENDAYVPSPGDYIFYDWQDGTNYATTDNTGAPDHVGIVEKVSGSTITVIEGNYSDSVKRRTIQVNGRYIRGYGVPKYASKAGNTNIPPVAQIPLEQREKFIWDYLKSKGLNDYAVAGIMGNLYAESALSPINLQNSFESKLGYTDYTYTDAVDKGTYTNFTRDGAGYGLAQWTYWSRKEALLTYTKSAEKSIGDLMTQLEFLWKELQGYSKVMSTIKGAKCILEASNIILTDFERPADQSEAVKIKRAGYGQVYFDKFAVVENPVESVDKEEEEMSFEQFYDWFEKAMDQYREKQAEKAAPSWSEEEFAAAIAAGITDGQRPLDFMSRVEGAVMNLRTLKAAKKE